MTTMNRTAALGALAALMLAIGSPRDAAAHPMTQWNNYNVVDNFTFRVSRDTTSPHSAIVVSWDEAHFHPGSDGRARLLDYRIFVRDTIEHRAETITQSCVRTSPTQQPLDGCIRRIVSLGGPSYSQTIRGLRPDRSYYVYLTVEYAVGEGFQHRKWALNPHNPRYNHITITTLPRQTTETPTPSHSHPLPAHAHDYAAASHAHSYAVPGHVHATRRHTHEYAAADHTHDGTGTTPGASTTPAAQTCPRFIEIVAPWTFTRGYARELVANSVLLAVDAIEYVRERTVPIVMSARNGSDEVEGIEIRLKEAHATRGEGSNVYDSPRAFILDGATFADVAASVRCQSAPVAVTTEDPPTPAPE